MLKRVNRPAIITIFILFCVSSVSAEQSSCIDCHQQANAYLGKQHQTAKISCIACHKGNNQSYQKASAHEGFVVSPGELANVSQTCGSCHQKHTQGVVKSRMHTGAGIVSRTRALLEKDITVSRVHSFQTLEYGVADSLLRKQCASCHLGQQRNRSNADPVAARGGGCLACHLNKTAQGKHPQLSAKVDDAHCFGCHSRSGRISLNYPGLAETETAASTEHKANLYHLGDGRLVEKKTADTHHQAGMACIDCHTGAGLMNLIGKAGSSSIDIQCNDCHDNRNPRITTKNWPDQYQVMQDKVPFDFSEAQQFLTTEQGTPLWHIEVNKNALILHSKLNGKALVIPGIDENHHPLPEQHKKLSCQSCHSTWVPQCLGCHIQYDGSQSQWDHVEQKATPGRWLEKRWGIRTASPTLGWLDEATIDVFMPGMIMSLEHPDLSSSGFIRQFASIAPHTSGRSRACHECHRSSQVLGLGEGQLKVDKGHLVLQPTSKAAADGLPADAWTSLQLQQQSMQTPENIFPRAFSGAEIDKIYHADLEIKQE